jgi:hypothetical protein
MMKPLAMESCLWLLAAMLSSDVTLSRSPSGLSAPTQAGRATNQTTPAVRLSGRWVLDAARSDFQRSMTLDIQVDGGAVTLKSTTQLPVGTETLVWTCTTDKQECLNAGKQAKDLRGSAWWDGDRLIVQREAEAFTAAAAAGSTDIQDGGSFRYRRTDTHSVSTDGQTLTVSMALETPDGPLALTLVFTRAT